MNNRFTKGGLYGTSSVNGSGNGKGKSGWKSSYPIFYREWRNPPRINASQYRSLTLIPVVMFCCIVAVVAGIAAFHDPENMQLPHLVATAQPGQAFRLAVNRAMSAAELTQRATSKEEWLVVLNWWKEAIDLMRIVPRTNPNYAIAQEKIGEYQRNLEYARAKTLAGTTTESHSLWSIGSRRADVIQIQGQPSQTTRYDTLCQETLSYSNSTVVLNNGIVTEFEDNAKNLKATNQNSPQPVPATDGINWTLGSTKEEVFRIQGTPARIVRYDTANREILFYGNSTLSLAGGRVIGYSNYDNNLRVSVAPIIYNLGNSDNFWTLGSERNEVLRVQGTPTQVVLNSSACEEIFHYGDSTVELTNGFTSGYNNVGNNLQVQVK